MPNQKIRKDLEALKAAIHRVSDADTQTKLQNLVDAIEAELASDLEGHASLKERLELAVTEFEQSHPKTATVINNIITTLGNMGI